MFSVDKTSHVNTLDRNTWEKRFNFPVNSSLFAAQHIIYDVHKQYYKFHNEIVEKIEKNTFYIDDNFKHFVSGAFEGDGSLSVTIKKKYTKFVPQFEIRICLYGDIHSKIFLRVIAFFFKDENPYIKSLFPNKKAFVYVLRRKQILLFIDFLKNYPICSSQGNLVIFVNNVLQKNYNTSFHASRKIAKCIYLYSSKRKKRKASLNTVVTDFKYFYNNTG